MITDSYISPPRVKHGGRIGVCAPSGAFDPEQFNSGIKILQGMGFDVHVPDVIYSKKRYMAGDEEIRAGVLNALFADSSIEGIICARGGFGALKILDLVDYELISRNPKLFIGFSDITALLVTISERCRMQVIHGPVVTSLSKISEESINSIFREMTSTKLSFDPSIAGESCRTIRRGVASGILTGGNLATLCHLTGTRFQPDFAEKILFLEDVGEPPYRIERMLSHMKMAGLFKGVKAVLLGSFSMIPFEESSGSSSKEAKESHAQGLHTDKQGDSGRNGNSEIIDEIFLELFDDPSVPILGGLNAGHGRSNISLRFSAMLEVDADRKSLKISDKTSDN